MSTSKLHATDRTFQVWEYEVSHGQLLIRSPKSPASRTSPEQLTNVDIICLDVEYMSLPRVLRGIEFARPTSGETSELERILRRRIEADRVNILQSEGSRFFVVALSLSMSENDWDIFDPRSSFVRGFALDRLMARLK